jgi:hypothetical protein
MEKKKFGEDALLFLNSFASTRITQFVVGARLDVTVGCGFSAGSGAIHLAICQPSSQEKVSNSPFKIGFYKFGARDRFLDFAKSPATGNFASLKMTELSLIRFSLS